MKETTNKTKRQTIEWEKIVANDISNEGLVSKVYKELLKLNTHEIKDWYPRSTKNFSNSIHVKQTIKLKNGQKI